MTTSMAGIGRLELVDLVVHGIAVSLTGAPGRTVVLRGAGGVGIGGGVRVDGVDARRRAASFGVLCGSASPAGRLRDVLGPGVPAGVLDRALRAADLRHLAAALPEGLETVVGPGGCRLSAQQRVQLEVARLLVADPSAVLLDCPTAGLDPPAADAVLRPLRRLMVGRTCVVVTTDPRFCDTADAVFEVADGRWRPVARQLPGAAGRYAMARDLTAA